MHKPSFSRRIIRMLLPFLLLPVLLVACAAQTEGPSNEFFISATFTSAPEESTVYITCSGEDLHRGNLLLVNQSHLYDASLCADEITSVREGRVSEIQEGTYQLPIGEVMLQTLEAMQADLQTAMGSDVCLLVNDAYRTAEAQQATIEEYLELYGQAYVDKYVAPVGTSEHHTALAVDLSFYAPSDQTVMATQSGEATAYYAWVLKNCRNYGLILRYTPEKEAITGYSAESWHFRYVGKPHADYIAANGLALEEYLEQLKETSFERRLFIQTDRGEQYSIYYVATTPGETSIPVPETKPYLLSGNNMDGFIITVNEGA